MYFLFILEAVAFGFYGYLSHRNNTAPSIGLFCSMWAIAIIPWWPIVTKYSKNLLLDSLIFNICLMVPFYVSLIIFGSEEITTTKGLGTVLIIFGLLLFTKG